MSRYEHNKISALTKIANKKFVLALLNKSYLEVKKREKKNEYSYFRLQTIYTYNNA